MRIPQTDDDLVFLNATTSSNDMSGVEVRSMRFQPGSSGTSILRGLPIALRGGISGSASGMGTGNFDVQCLLILNNTQPFTFDGNRLTLSGGVDLNSHDLNLSSTLGMGNIFVGPISGAGTMSINGPGTIHFFGAGNSFTGTMRANSGVAQFEKNAGQLAIPATGRLEIGGGGRVQLQGNNQVADSSAVVVESFGQLLLNGFNEVFSEGLTLFGGAIVDCGNNYGGPGLTLVSNLTVRATNNSAVIRNGIVDLNGMPTLDIAGPAPVSYTHLRAHET